MAKSDSNKSETDSPKKVEKKGFFSRVARDVKNLAVGIASLPAHFATNPLDMGAKTGLIAASAIPVFGSIVTAVYAFKQSMRNEELGVGSVVKSLVKAAIVGAASAAPGVGPAIMTAYVATNIGEQVEQTVEASKRAGVPKTTFEAVQDKYKEAGQNIKSLGDPEKRAEIGQKIKSSISVEGIKNAIKENVGPLTSKGVEENTQKLAEKIKQEGPKPSVPKPSIKTRIMNKLQKKVVQVMVSPVMKEQVSKIHDGLVAKQNQKKSTPQPKDVVPFKQPPKSGINL
jgi:hypothetical protein